MLAADVAYIFCLHPFCSTLPVASSVKLGINPSDNAYDVQLSGLKWLAAWETHWCIHDLHPLSARCLSSHPSYFLHLLVCHDCPAHHHAQKRKEKERKMALFPPSPPRISEPHLRKQGRAHIDVYAWVFVCKCMCVCVCVCVFTWPEEPSHSRSECLRVTGTVSDGGTL